jgi:hypothetical protein
VFYEVVLQGGLPFVLGQAFAFLLQSRFNVLAHESGARLEG